MSEKELGCILSSLQDPEGRATQAQRKGFAMGQTASVTQQNRVECLEHGAVGWHVGWLHCTALDC